MTAAALKLLLCAAQLKLATVGFTQVGLSDAQAGFYAEHFSVQLASVDESVRVSTPKDMAAVLGIEKQKQLLGCADAESSCMAELAGALGADGLVTGQLAKIGKSFQLNVKILAADGSRTLFLHSSKLLSTEEELIEELNGVAAKAIAKVRAQLAPKAAPGTAVASEPEPVAEVVETGGRTRSKLKLLPAALGIVSVGFGGLFLIFAQNTYRSLSDPNNWATLDSGQASSYRLEGKGDVTVGSILLPIGVAIIVGSLLWYLLS